MDLKIGDKLRFTKNYPVTAFDQEGVPVSISQPWLGIVRELPKDGFPQILIHNDTAEIELVGVPMETIDGSAEKVQ